MKKFMVLALVFALAAGMVFADINFGGGVNAGFTFKFDDTRDPKWGQLWGDYAGAYANTWHDDADNFRHNLKASYSQDYYGLEGGMKMRVNGSNGWSFEQYDVGAWVKPFQNDFLQINIGQTGGDWGSPTARDTGTGDAALRFNFKPGVEGLSFGFTFGDRNWLDPTGIWGKVDNSHYKFGESVPAAPSAKDLAAWSDSRREFLDYLMETGLGVKYDVSAVTVAAGLRLKADVLSNDGRVYAGLKLKPELFGVPGLSVGATVQADRLLAFSAGDFWWWDFGSKPEWIIDQDTGKLKQEGGSTPGWKSGYNVGGRIYGELDVTYETSQFYVRPRIDISLYPSAKVPDPDDYTKEVAADLGWKFEVEPAYKIFADNLDKLKVWVNFNIQNVNKYLDTSNWSNAYDQPTNKKDQMMFNITPGVQYQILKIGNAELLGIASLGYHFDSRQTADNRKVTDLEGKVVDAKDSRIDGKVAIRFNFSY